MEIKDNENISIEECMKRMHKSREFILNAIQQNVLPGAVVVNESGRRSPHIPRKAFEEYMTTYRQNPTDALVTALFNFIGESFPNSKKDLAEALINALEKEKADAKTASAKYNHKYYR